MAAWPGPPRQRSAVPYLSLAVAYAVGGVELFGALLLAACLLTRLAALPIIIDMSVIITVILWPDGYFWTRQGYEYALLRDLLCVAILIGGAGAMQSTARCRASFGRPPATATPAARPCSGPS